MNARELADELESLLPDLRHSRATHIQWRDIDVTKDYSPANCRWVSRRVQSINRKMMPTNTSGFRGVSFAKTMGRWLSAITHRRKRKNLGYFKDKHVAAHAYNKAAIQLHGEHAMLNPVGSKEGVICDDD